MQPVHQVGGGVFRLKVLVFETDPVGKMVVAEDHGDLGPGVDGAVGAVEQVPVEDVAVGVADDLFPKEWARICSSLMVQRKP